MALTHPSIQKEHVAETGDNADEAWLQMALRTAATTGPSARGRRGLYYMVLEVSRDRWRRVASTTTAEDLHTGTTDTDETLQQFENLLAGIGTALGLAKQPTVTEAKTQLRELGKQGTVLASRLGQQSKDRNRRAHPGAAQRLLAQVEQLACASTSAAEPDMEKDPAKDSTLEETTGAALDEAKQQITALQEEAKVYVADIEATKAHSVQLAAERDQDINKFWNRLATIRMHIVEDLAPSPTRDFILEYMDMPIQKRYVSTRASTDEAWGEPWSSSPPKPPIAATTGKPAGPQRRR